MRVIYITNTNDSGPGSFHWAMNQSGPRIIIFEVSVLVNLNSHIVFPVGTRIEVWK